MRFQGGDSLHCSMLCHWVLMLCLLTPAAGGPCLHLRMAAPAAQGDGHPQDLLQQPAEQLLQEQVWVGMAMHARSLLWASCSAARHTGTLAHNSSTPASQEEQAL